MSEELPLPESLQKAVERAVQDIARQAFVAGYEQGAKETADRIVQAARGFPGQTPVKPSLISPVPKSDIHPNAAENRRFPYGAVANAFRGALWALSPLPAPKAKLIATVSEILRQDVSDMNHVDTLKRLKRSEELVIEDGRYRAGPKLSEPPVDYILKREAEKQKPPDNAGGNDGGVAEWSNAPDS